MRDADVNHLFVCSVRDAKMRLRTSADGVYVSTEFDDGKCCGNWPHPDDPSYTKVAEDCGFGPGQLLQYCFMHEVGHLLVPHRLFDARGYVSRMSAEERRMNLAAAKAEERLIYYCQVAAGKMVDGTPVPGVLRSLGSTVAAADPTLLTPAFQLAAILRAWRLGHNTFTND